MSRLHCTCWLNQRCWLDGHFISTAKCLCIRRGFPAGLCHVYNEYFSGICIISCKMMPFVTSYRFYLIMWKWFLVLNTKPRTNLLNTTREYLVSLMVWANWQFLLFFNCWQTHLIVDDTFFRNDVKRWLWGFQTLVQCIRRMRVWTFSSKSDSYSWFIFRTD